MVYDRMDKPFSEHYQDEIDIEGEFLYPNPEMVCVFNKAKAANKTVIIASDMYLPTEGLAKILENNQITGYTKLYVSGDVGLKKSTGSLFKHILAD